MRIPLTARQSWPVGETIEPLPSLAVDLGWIVLYATRNAWPNAARVTVTIEYFDTDDSKWKPVVGFAANGGNAVDLRGNPVTESYAGTRKRHPETDQTLPYFRNVWPKLNAARLPQLRLRVNTTRAINSRIEVDW